MKENGDNENRDDSQDGDDENNSEHSDEENEKLGHFSLSFFHLEEPKELGVLQRKGTNTKFPDFVPVPPHEPNVVPPDEW